jgi:hypothetical protein
VRAGLRRRVGTPVTDGAIDDRYGEARFLPHQSAHGILQYQIMLLARPAPNRRAEPLDFVWRDSSAAEIVDQLVAAYEMLQRRNIRL